MGKVKFSRVSSHVEITSSIIVLALKRKKFFAISECQLIRLVLQFGAKIFNKHIYIYTQDIALARRSIWQYPWEIFAHMIVIFTIMANLASPWK